MRMRDPSGRPVLFHYSNMEAFRGRRAKKELVDWMNAECGPPGVLWTTRRHPEGLKVFFVKDDHAVHAALRWGGA